MYGVDEPVEVVLALHTLGALDPALAQLRSRGKWELRSLLRDRVPVRQEGCSARLRFDHFVVRLESARTDL